MIPEEQTIDTEQPNNRVRNKLRIWVKNFFKFLSVLMIPLTLGIFTVVITVHQQNIAREQRMEDLQLARQQRLEDRNETRLQRDLDWNIATLQRETESKATTDRYRDELLVTYIREISDWLRENNGSLTSNSDSLMSTLARVKTLNVLRQLDGSRQTLIISFLYEAKQLTDTAKSIALDLSTVTLIDIDFQKVTSLSIVTTISLVGIYLQNCTFEKLNLTDVKFSSARFSMVNFSSAYLGTVNFSTASFEHVDFPFTRHSNVNFLSTRLENVSFIHAIFVDVNFGSATVSNASFFTSSFSDTSFSSSNLQNVNFSSSWFRQTNFSQAIFKNVHFPFTQLGQTNFSSAEFDSEITSFHHAVMAQSIFTKCSCYTVDFTGADLNGSLFHHAKLERAIFTLANLQYADFSNTSITDIQLQSALSIRNAILPNGTLGQGQNLVKNGDPDCNLSLLDHWQAQNGRITVMRSEEDRSKCQFTLQSVGIGAIMSQRIVLVDIWDPTLWTGSKVELQAHMSNGISMKLNGRDRNGTVQENSIANWPENKTSMALKTQMQELEIVIAFNAAMNTNHTGHIWCNNIELFIDYNKWF